MARAEAQIDVKLNERPAIAGLKRLATNLRSFSGVATSAMNGAGAAFAGLGVAIGGAGVALAAMTRSQSEFIREQRQLADNIGVSVERFSALTNLASTFGAEADDVQDVLKELSVKARDGSEAYKSLGINAKNANGTFKESDVLLGEVQQQLAKVATQGERNAIVDELLSDAGIRLQGVLSMTREETEAYIQASIAAGEVVTKNAATIQDHFNRALGDASTALGALARDISVRLMGAMVPVINQMTEWVRLNRAWIQSGFASVLVAMADTVVPALATATLTVVRAWQGWRAIISVVELAINKFFEGMSWSIERTLAGLGFLASYVSSDLAAAIGGAQESMRGLTDSFGDGAEDASRDLVDLVRQTDQLDRQIGTFGRNASEVLRNAAKDAKSLAAALGEANTATRTGGGLRAGAAGAGGGRRISLSGAQTDEAFGLDQAEAAKSQLQQLRDQVVAIGADIRQTVGTAFASSVAGAFESVITGVASPMEALQNLVGETLMTIGRMVLQAGVAAALLGPLGILPGFQAFAPGIALGAAAVAGGAAIVAVGAAIKGSGSSDSGAVSSAGVSGASTAAATASRPRIGTAVPTQVGGSSTGGGQTVINVNFNRVVTDPRRVARELRDALDGVLPVGGR